jgi:hypothetical protein
MTDDPLGEAQDDGRSIGERAANGEHDEPMTEAELFPMGSLEGDEVTPQSIIKRGAPVEVTVSLSKAEVPLRGSGLLDPNRSGRVLVSFIPGVLEEVPKREDAGDPNKVTGWKIRQNLRAVYVRPATNDADLIRAAFDSLMADDAAGAGALLDALREQLSSALQEA